MCPDNPKFRAGPLDAPAERGDGAVAVLVVDNDQDTCAQLESYLTARGFRVRTTLSPAEMWQILNNNPVDILVLGLILPGDDGINIIGKLRARLDLGIVILTEPGDEVDRIVGLELGADDSVTKPVNLRELLARIRSILRRLGRSQPSHASTATFAGLRIDLQSWELTDVHGQQIHLTSQEFRLLEALVKKPSQGLKREHLFQAISDKKWNASDRSVDTLIFQLRKKLESDADRPSLIKSVRGVGYMLAADVEYV